MTVYLSYLINPLLALMYQNILDLNVTCRAKRTHVLART
jgi:hypothetical protein